MTASSVRAVAAVTWGPVCHGRNRDRQCWTGPCSCTAGLPSVRLTPLLTRARALAERLGITVPYTLPGLDEASLDLDV